LFAHSDELICLGEPGLAALLVLIDEPGNCRWRLLIAFCHVIQGKRVHKYGVVCKPKKYSWAS
jgi:hypothetical protein